MPEADAPDARRSIGSHVREMLGSLTLLLYSIIETKHKPKVELPRAAGRSDAVGGQ